MTTGTMKNTLWAGKSLTIQKSMNLSKWCFSTSSYDVKKVKYTEKKTMLDWNEKYLPEEETLLIATFLIHGKNEQ